MEDRLGQFRSRAILNEHTLVRGAVSWFRWRMARAQAQTQCSDQRIASKRAELGCQGSRQIFFQRSESAQESSRYSVILLGHHPAICSQTVVAGLFCARNLQDLLRNASHEVSVDRKLSHQRLRADGKCRYRLPKD